MTIALLCPTRGRSAQCQRMIESAYRTTDTKVCIYLAETEGDKGYAIEQPSSDVLRRIEIGSIPTPDGQPTGYKWNMLAEIALENPNNKLFMLAADDMVFTTPCWDKALIDHYNALENKIHVYALRDSRDENGTPHPIVTREYIEAMGYFLPPIFLHWFVDSWTVEIAKANNCFTHLKNYLLVHDKPSDKGQGDETHNRIRAMGWRERDKWVNEHCQHFLQQEKHRLRGKIHGHELRPGVFSA